MTFQILILIGCFGLAKLFWVLQKFKDGSDAYMVVVLMLLYFEECVGVKLDAKGWDTMRLLAVDAWKEKG